MPHLCSRYCTECRGMLANVTLTAHHSRLTHSHLICVCACSCTRWAVSTVKYLYRVRTEIWLWFPDFSRAKLLLFSKLFKAFCVQDITKLAFKRLNLLYNVFITELASNFWNLNWKKINSNKFMGNQQCNRHMPFPGQHYSFKDFSRLCHTYDNFQGFSKPWKFLHQIQGLSRLFQVLYKPC